MSPGFYMHANAMDCCIEIIKVQYRDSKRIKARVRWWNLGFTGNAWVLRFNDPIEISTSELPNWKQINPLTHRLNSRHT